VLLRVPDLAMAIPFFPDKWETLAAEELQTARARLAGFIEGTPDKDKTLRDVRISQVQFNI
jgi:hypothetical protein